MTLCSPCSVSLSVHITDLIGECQRNTCTSQRKANMFFLEKKVAEVLNSCKRLMPLNTVPIYIYMLFNPNCYWTKNGNNVFVLNKLGCSLFYRYLNQFFLHRTYCIHMCVRTCQRSLDRCEQCSKPG